MAKHNDGSSETGFKSKLVTGSKISVGTLLMALLPQRRQRMEKLATIPWHSDSPPDAIDRLIRTSLFWWRSRDASGEQLADLHQQFWREQSASDYYAGTEARFEKVFLPHFDHLLDLVKTEMENRNLKNVVEIGCGDGQLLRHIQQRIPAERFIGLDLSEDQIKENIKRDAELALEYYSGDASQWIKTDSPSSSLYVTGLGVLEYFTQTQLETLLQSISSESSPACALFIEPIDTNADLLEFDSSYSAGEEHSFTHNYPSRLREAGWSIEHSEEVSLPPYRWLVVIAACGHS